MLLKRRTEVQRNKKSSEIRHLFYRSIGILHAVDSLREIFVVVSNIDSRQSPSIRTEVCTESYETAGSVVRLSVSYAVEEFSGVWRRKDHRRSDSCVDIRTEIIENVVGKEAVLYTGKNGDQKKSVDLSGYECLAVDIYLLNFVRVIDF